MLFSFDLDGVLIENPFIKGVFPEIEDILSKQYFAINNKKITKEKIREHIIEEYKNRLNSNFSYRSYNWDEIIQTVANQIGCAGGIDVVKLVKKYCRRPYIKVYSDVYDILEWLRSKGHQLVVITNGFYRYQFPVLNKLKLDFYFDKIITPETTRAIKPEKKIFMEAGSGDDIWYHIGDSLVQDIFGANRIGARSIWLRRDFPEDLIKIGTESFLSNTKAYNFLKNRLEDELSKNLKYNPVKEKYFFPEYTISSLRKLKFII